MAVDAGTAGASLAEVPGLEEELMPARPAGKRAARAGVGNQRSRAASWNALVTGESRYSRTVRVPRWISAETCMPGVSR